MPGRTSIRPEKTARVQALARSMEESSMTALIGFRGVPGGAMQSMRRELRGKGHPMVVAPNSALRHALEIAIAKRPALQPLFEHVTDQTGLLVAKGNPFALAHELLGTRSPTPARGGEIAPNDIVVPSGATSFKPGPIVGELQHAGFPAAIEKGKVVIKKDVTIVKAGGVISREVAGLLTRMDILPLEVGLDLRALVDGSTFYPNDVLQVDLDARREDVVRGQRLAIGVALALAWPTPTTIRPLVTKAHRGAIALAVEAGYVTPSTLPLLVARAAREAAAVQAATETK
ncbi:MAG: 50S ribosomal protein L10 [Thermoplasmata archaeon]|nr:50S ribosomal protein L10 [Thermoplasmata archaeon]